jgi:hypothetical protein
MALADIADMPIVLQQPCQSYISRPMSSEFEIRMSATIREVHDGVHGQSVADGGNDLAAALEGLLTCSADKCCVRTNAI